MSVEIERKFLVPGGWPAANDGSSATVGTRYRQAYLAEGDRWTVRVRIAGARARLTVKSTGSGMSRLEYEYEIPVAEAEEMIEGLGPAVIDKTRYVVSSQGRTWEVDVFHGPNEGLVLAEVELASEDDEVELPIWVAEEVTGDRRYYNASLAKRPFRNWSAGS